MKNQSKKTIDTLGNLFKTQTCKPPEPDLTEEEEKFVISAGQCFGEWGLLNKSERSSSALCLEDCDLFVLNAQSFELSFNVSDDISQLEMYDEGRN